MKKNILLITFLIVLTLAVLLAGSIYFLDRHKIMDAYENGLLDGQIISSNSYLSAEKDLEPGIKKINADKVQLAMVIKESEDKTNKIEIYNSKKRNLNLDDYINYEIKDGVMDIKYGRGKMDFFDNIVIVLSLENLKDIDLSINELEGVLTIEDPMGNMEIKDLEGVLNIESDLKKMNVNKIQGLINVDTYNSFDMDIGKIEGVTNISFGQINANIDIKEIEGVFEILGDSFDPFKEENSYQKTIGTGENKIIIDSVEGILTIVSQ